jgi:hypothetical protein
MRDLDMKRRGRIDRATGLRPSRSKQRRRGERLAMLFAALIFAILCLAMLIHGRFRTSRVAWHSAVTAPPHH